MADGEVPAAEGDDASKTEERDRPASTSPVETDGAGDGKNKPGAATKPIFDSRETDTPSNGAGSRQGRTLVVGDDEMYAGELQYATLRAACHAAKSGDPIELRYDGPRIERPIRFKQNPITIRAGKHPDGRYYRPQIVFRPLESDLTEFGNGMFVLESKCAVRLEGLHMILDPAEVAAQQWSLISLVGAKSLVANNCWLTIRNSAAGGGPYHRDVAFFHLRPSNNGGVMKMVDPKLPIPAVSIRLGNCVVRGEARVVQIDELQRVDFRWTNGLCATTQPFVYATGGKVEPADAQTTSRVELRHLTAVLDGGLLAVESTKIAPHQQRFEVQCADSILLGDAETPLVQQTGIDEVDALKGRITYFGTRPFYQGIRKFWAVDARHANGTESLVLDFDAWREHWGFDESYPLLDQVIWRTPPARDKPAHLRTPGEFQLASTSSNPAKGGGEDGASDGKDAGMLTEQIRDLVEADSKDPNDQDAARPVSAD